MKYLIFAFLAVLTACSSKGPVVLDCEEAGGMMICKNGNQVCTRHEDQSLVCVQ